jgi:hypothetical protein
VPIEWLRRSVAAGKVSELIERVGAELQRHAEGMHNAAMTVQQLTATPTLAVGAAFTEVASQIGYQTVVQDWRAAAGDIVLDPPNAIARACSLTESVCKHLLADLGVDLPADQSIQPLFKATAKALGLDPAEQADPELKGLCRGLSTVAQNLGALRTNFSTAHGSGPNHTPLTTSHARLAVNAAGNISTFLMEQWQGRKQSMA